MHGHDGVELHVETTGEGPPVLLVHGFPDSGRLWRNQVGPIAGAGFTRDRARPARHGRGPSGPRASRPTGSPTCWPT